MTPLLRFSLRFVSLALFSVPWLCLAEDPPPQADAPAAEPPPVIAPEQARENLGKKVTVEFTVAAAKELTDKNIAFLNSHTDLKSPENFTVFINGTGLRKLREANKEMEDAGQHYLNKKIRVTGKIELYKEKIEIVVSSPDQITIVESTGA